MSRCTTSPAIEVRLAVTLLLGAFLVTTARGTSVADTDTDTDMATTHRNPHP